MIDKKKRLFYTNGDIDPVQVLFGVLILLIVLFFLVVGYLSLLHDNPPATIINIEYTPQTLAPGDHLSYHVEWCKKTRAPVVISRVWVGEFLENQPDVKANDVHGTAPRGNFGPGCRVDAIHTPIPALRPGEYKQLVTFTYQVNILAARSVSFEVSPIYVVTAD